MNYKKLDCNFAQDEDIQSSFTEINENKCILNNEIFDLIDFSNINQLVYLINLININENLYDDDFKIEEFYNQILNTMLTFDRALVFYSAELFLRLSYKTKSTTSYLSLHINEIVAVINEFLDLKNLFLLFQNIIIDYPATIHEILSLNFLNIIFQSVNQNNVEILKTCVSTLQILTNNTSFFNFDQIHQIIEIFKFLLQNDSINTNRDIFEPLFQIITHIQKYHYLTPEELFNTDSINYILLMLAKHTCILPILSILSHFKDPSFAHYIFSITVQYKNSMNEFLSINLYHIFRSIFSEPPPIWIKLVVYFNKQIGMNPELVLEFSQFLPFAISKVEKEKFIYKIKVQEFFLLCLNYLFENTIKQPFSQSILCDIFDSLESLDSSNDLILFVIQIFNNHSDDDLMQSFIQAHPECYQSIYNQCSSDNEIISHHAQLFISMYNSVSY